METPYRLIGHERDESGLYEMGARQYDPGLGRWLTPDPLFVWSPQQALRSPREQNLYAYVNAIQFASRIRAGSSAEQRSMRRASTEGCFGIGALLG